MAKKSAKAIKDAITAEINKEPLARIDYVDVVDFETITPVDEIKGNNTRGNCCLYRKDKAD